VTGYLPADDRYRSIPYRRCRSSGLLLPAVSLGLWHKDIALGRHQYAVEGNDLWRIPATS
jgi:hypothetical protein